MARWIVSKDPDPLESGNYPANFYDFEVRDGQHGEYYLWKFKVYGNGTSQIATGLTGVKFGNHSKECRFAEVLRGAPLQPGDAVDLGELLGRPCRVKLELKPRRDGQGKTNNVVDLLPAEPGAAALDPQDLPPDDNPFA